MRVNRRTVVAGLSASLAVGSTARAQQDYPNRPVKLVVCFAAGGVIDVMTRLVAEKLSARLGQPVIVENRPGANGTIGALFVAKSDPDGYTILPHGGSTWHTSMVANLPINMFRDFDPITLGSVFPSVLVTSAQTPVKTLAEFVDYAKKNPGKLNYGSAGASNQLAAAMFLKMAGLEMTHVPYKGTAGTTAALLANEVQFLVDPLLTHKANYEAGKTTVLAVTTKVRSPIMPNVPTVGEVGYPDMLATSNNGFWAPKGTPAPVIQRLHRELTAVLNSDEVKERYMALAAAVVQTTTPEGLAEYIRKDQEFWANAAKVANYTPEA